jgi:hypothetical protein
MAAIINTANMDQIKFFFIVSPSCYFGETKTIIVLLANLIVFFSKLSFLLLGSNREE